MDVNSEQFTFLPVANKAIHGTFRAEVGGVTIIPILCYYYPSLIPLFSDCGFFEQSL